MALQRGEKRPARSGPAHRENSADLDWIVEKLSGGAGCSKEPLGLAAPPCPIAHPHTHLLYTHTPHQNMGDRIITQGTHSPGGSERGGTRGGLHHSSILGWCISGWENCCDKSQRLFSEM